MNRSIESIAEVARGSAKEGALRLLVLFSSRARGDARALGLRPLHFRCEAGPILREADGDLLEELRS